MVRPIDLCIKDGALVEERIVFVGVWVTQGMDGLRNVSRTAWAYRSKKRAVVKLKSSEMKFSLIDAACAVKVC